VGLEERGDPTELGTHAGGDDDPLGPPVGDGGALEDHVVPVDHQRSIADGERVGCLGGGLGLAGEGGFVDPQAVHVNQADSSRDHVASGELDEIAGHELRRRNLQQRPPRITRAAPVVSCLNAAIARSARYS